MNKTDFIARVAEKATLSKTDARAAVDAFAEVVGEELKKAKIKIPARKAVKFKAGAALDLKIK